MLDQQALHAIEARCTQEALPRCRARCPLRMDVRAFMEHMGDGHLREARKLLERHLPLPEILGRICDHPCEDVCLRRDLGGSLAIGGLEAACLAGVPQQTKFFPRAPKPARIAVLGDALAGLVVAFELSKKAYPVSIFYENQPGDALLRRFSALPEALVRQQMQALTTAGCTLVQRPLTPDLLDEIRADFAGIFVDADAAANIFAALPKPPDMALGLVEAHVCAGGMLEQSPTGALYASSSAQAGQGRRAAVTLERMVTGVSLTASREAELTSTTPLQTSLAGIAPQQAVLPAARTYSAAEAQTEAARCIRCQCLACVRQCVYLQKHGSYPRVYARSINNNATIVKGEHMANKLVTGCMLCGQCTELCPERFSMAEVCLWARQDMVERNYMPPSAYEFALEDMADASGHACALALPDPARGDKALWAFFPGCQLAASRGEQVLATYAYLRDMLPHDGVSLLLSCCGVPAHWAGEKGIFAQSLQHLRQQWQKLGKPTLMLACASCLKTFREHAPDIAVVSLWDMLDRHADTATVTAPAMTCTVHDPCAARHDTAWQGAVRRLAARCGVTVQEPPLSGAQTACCGYGGGTWCSHPELAQGAATHRAQALDGVVLASCIMCRDMLAGAGKECLHLLDVLPFARGQHPDGEGRQQAASAKAPGLSERRARRAALRREALRRYDMRNAGQETQPAPYRVCIAPDLLTVLEGKHILRQDVEEAVLAVEAAGQRFREARSGHLVGSWRPRNVTFWVCYSVEGSHYQLHDAWCHRMRVPGAGGGPM